MYPTLSAGALWRTVTDSFLGYDCRPRISEGALGHTHNLTGRHYPLLSVRGPRGHLGTVAPDTVLLGKSRLAVLSDTTLTYGGADLTQWLHAAGYFLPRGIPRQLVSMGAYLLIFPDKLYINTEDFSDCGSLEAHFTAGGEVRYSLCDAQGTVYPAPNTGDAAPADPKPGDLWLDGSGTLRQYGTAEWVQVAGVYVRLDCPGIGAQFRQYDGVNLSGCTGPAACLNGTTVLYAVDKDWVCVPGILEGTYLQSDGTVSMTRTVPQMDFVVEAQNRLWGCKYGLVSGQTVNEIYCCALGDFRNWNRFMGLSTDSYAAAVGTDGPFTGAVTHLGHPIFFKEQCMHRVYVSPAGAHQITDTACRGVQQGSHRSLAVVGETLFYKSPGDVCAYDGSLPVSVSAPLGGVRYKNAVAGPMDDRYFISMEAPDGTTHLFVYDTLRGLWHREDGLRAADFAPCGGELYCVDGDSGALLAMGGTVGQPEQDIPWQADTGAIGYADPEQKYVSRLTLRMELPEGSAMDVYLSYDSDGIWHHAGHLMGTGTGSFTLPLRPRRCDHFRVRLEGTGPMKLFAMTKHMEQGSEIT